MCRLVKSKNYTNQVFLRGRGKGKNIPNFFFFSIILCNYFTGKIEGPVINGSLKGTYCLLSVPFPSI